MTQGVVKRIIPAVASTNAVISAACAMEVFKLLCICAEPDQDYMVFNDSDGIYTYAYKTERKEDCLVCSQTAKNEEVSGDMTLQCFIDRLISHPSYQMRKPGITTNVDGKSKTLYMSNPVSIEEATRPNLKKSLQNLGLVNGCEVVVADETSPMPLIFRLSFKS